MFGLKTVKKFFSGKEKEAPQKPSLKIKLHEKFDHVSDFIGKKITEFLLEYAVIREKLKDLSKTNYELGKKHLSKGNVKEAIFRFKLVKKFWPNNYDAYYQLAYALILDKKMPEARKILEELITKNSAYEAKVTDLLNSITRIREEYMDQMEKKS